MPEILFVSEYAGFFGGIERYVKSTAELLRGAGFGVAGMFEKTVDGAGDFLRAFDRVEPWGDPGLIAGKYDFAVVHKVRSGRWLAELEKLMPVVVVVHDHEYYCPRFCRYYPFVRRNCHRRYCRLVCGICGMTRRRSGGWSGAFRENFYETPKLWNAVCRAEALVVLSDFMAENLRVNGVAAEKIVKIPPAIFEKTQSAAGAAERRPGRTPHVVCVGQLIRGKGVDQLLAAVKLTKCDFVLDILGDGGDAAMLREQARPLGDRVCFHSYVTDPDEFYRQSVLAVLPWRWQEPFGLVGPEAQLHSLPLVGFDLGGVREYLIDGVNGILVPQGDVAAFAAAIDRLLASPSTIAEYGANGRRLAVEKFSAAALVAAYGELAKRFNAGKQDGIIEFGERI